MLCSCSVERCCVFGSTRTRPGRARRRQYNGQYVKVRAQEDDSSGGAEGSTGRPNALTATVKRKQKQVAELIEELGMDTLEEKLQSATASPARPPYRFVQLIQVPGDNLSEYHMLPQVLYVPVSLPFICTSVSNT